MGGVKEVDGWAVKGWMGRGSERVVYRKWMDGQ